MKKIDALRRFFLPCLHPKTGDGTAAPAAAKKRLSASLRLDLDDASSKIITTTSSSPPTPVRAAPPRSSRTMVIGTIFGHRRGGRAWFCVQHDRLTPKPSLLLELSIPTAALVHEMKCGLVRIALEFNAGESPESELHHCHLHSVPIWTLFCNGRKMGFAVRRKANAQMTAMLRTMQNVTVGAGVIPFPEEIIYMRANYEFVVGSADSESFHLINPDDGPGQELSIFLIRS
ncbi:hypothetical protein M569_13617, partial [Genlisea aurea]